MNNCITIKDGNIEQGIEVRNKSVYVGGIKFAIIVIDIEPGKKPRQKLERLTKCDGYCFIKKTPRLIVWNGPNILKEGVEKTVLIKLEHDCGEDIRYYKKFSKRLGKALIRGNGDEVASCKTPIRIEGLYWVRDPYSFLDSFCF